MIVGKDLGGSGALRRGSRLGLSGPARRDALPIDATHERSRFRSLSLSKGRGREPVGKPRRRDGVLRERLRPPRPPRRSDPIRFASTHADPERDCGNGASGFRSHRRGSRLGPPGSARRDALPIDATHERSRFRSLSLSKGRGREPVGRARRRDGALWGATPPTPPRRSDPVRFASTHAEGAHDRREGSGWIGSASAWLSARALRTSPAGRASDRRHTREVQIPVPEPVEGPGQGASGEAETARRCPPGAASPPQTPQAL
jgi:hypothetical protein